MENKIIVKIGSGYTFLEFRRSAFFIFVAGFLCQPLSSTGSVSLTIVSIAIPVIIYFTARFINVLKVSGEVLLVIDNEGLHCQYSGYNKSVRWEDIESINLNVFSNPKTFIPKEIFKKQFKVFVHSYLEIKFKDNSIPSEFFVCYLERKYTKYNIKSTNMSKNKLLKRIKKDFRNQLDINEIMIY